MKSRISFRDLMYDLADKLFPSAMDKAYDQGIRIGAEHASRVMSFEITQIAEKQKLTAAQKVGYELALQAVKDAKRKITARTGAML
jgi:hypothetical protein